jgi:hypothetical protein
VEGAIEVHIARLAVNPAHTPPQLALSHRMDTTDMRPAPMHHSIPSHSVSMRTTQVQCARVQVHLAPAEQLLVPVCIAHLAAKTDVLVKAE